MVLKKTSPIKLEERNVNKSLEKGFITGLPLTRGGKFDIQVWDKEPVINLNADGEPYLEGSSTMNILR